MQKETTDVEANLIRSMSRENSRTNWSAKDFLGNFHRKISTRPASTLSNLLTENQIFGYKLLNTIWIVKRSQTFPFVFLLNPSTPLLPGSIHSLSLEPQLLSKQPFLLPSSGHLKAKQSFSPLLVSLCGQFPIFGHYSSFLHVKKENNFDFLCLFLFQKKTWETENPCQVTVLIDSQKLTENFVETLLKLLSIVFGKFNDNRQPVEQIDTIFNQTNQT